MDYIGIKDNKSEIVIKKSRFIAYAYAIDGEEDAQSKLAFLRKKYYDSTHVCYAYIADEKGDLVKFSDDGEPGGTAGQPILEVLRKSGLKKVLVAVVRYFGGTLLGAGGLVRAYSQSASDALRTAEKIRYSVRDLYSVSLDFSVYKKISPKIERVFSVEKVGYTDVVTVEFSAAKGTNVDEIMSEFTLGKVGARRLGEIVKGEKYEQAF